MLQNLIKIGAPSFFPIPKNEPGGAGVACSVGVQTVLNGQHKFLPFVPNGINWTASGGEDVISGSFSGCIMAAYSENGVAKVAHISTGEYGDCKPEWERIKARSTRVFEFKPSDFGADTGRVYCFGLITSDLQTFTILVSGDRVRAPSGEVAVLPAGLKFVKIEKAHLLR